MFKQEIANSSTNTLPDNLFGNGIIPNAKAPGSLYFRAPKEVIKFALSLPKDPTVSTVPVAPLIEMLKNVPPPQEKVSGFSACLLTEYMQGVDAQSSSLSTSHRFSCYEVHFL